MGGRVSVQVSPFFNSFLCVFCADFCNICLHCASMQANSAARWRGFRSKAELATVREHKVSTARTHKAEGAASAGSKAEVMAAAADKTTRLAAVRWSNARGRE